MSKNTLKSIEKMTKNNPKVPKHDQKPPKTNQKTTISTPKTLYFHIKNTFMLRTRSSTRLSNSSKSINGHSASKCVYSLR